MTTLRPAWTFSGLISSSLMILSYAGLWEVTHNQTCSGATIVEPLTNIHQKDHGAGLLHVLQSSH